MTLSIEGCCPDVLVQVGKFELHKLDAVRLRGLDLVLMTDEPFLFDRCAEVTIEDCRITRAESPGTVCAVGGALRLQIENCVLDGRVGVDDANLDDVRDLIALPQFEFALKANDLAETLVADIGAKKQLATKISRARRTERLSPGEQEAYNLLVETLKDEVAPPAIVAAFGRLRAAAAFAFVGPTLVLLDGGAEALIEATDIVGTLALYGLPLGTMPEQDLLKVSRAALAEGRLGFRGGGSLHVRDVRVTRVTVSAKLLEQLASLPAGAKVVLDAFRALHVVDTEVLRNGNVVVAEHATLGGVDFAERKSDVGALIAESAIVTGTRAPDDVRLFVVANDLATAGNLKINVVSL